MGARSMPASNTNGEKMQLSRVMIARSFAALAMSMALLGAIDSSPAHADTAAIKSLMAATWDKPDARLLVEPVVVADGYAIASWTQGKRGGRALLRQEDGKWKIVLCSGDPLKSASSIAEAGVPHATAEQLARRLKEAESILPPRQVALFSTFEGVVHIDGGEHGHGKHSGDN